MHSTIPQQIARHFREIHFGGNWTCSNLKDQLSTVDWQQAITPVYSFNTIATLSFHIHYYVSAVLRVLQGEALNAKDENSFTHPEIASQEDWDHLRQKMWEDAGAFANLLEQLPEEKLGDAFTDEKYGTYYRNLHGIIEHSHYHLGQIVLIKKILEQQTT